MKRDMVAAFVIENGKLLLVHNTKHASLRIEPPGGKKEAGETWKEAVKRELKEELGIEVDVKNLFGVFSTKSPEGDFSVHTYFCTIDKGTPFLAEPDKISAFGWYSFKEISEFSQKGTLVPNMKTALRKLALFL